MEIVFRDFHGSGNRIEKSGRWAQVLIGTDAFAGLISVDFGDESGEQWSETFSLAESARNAVSSWLRLSDSERVMLRERWSKIFAPNRSLQ